MSMASTPLSSTDSRNADGMEDVTQSVELRFGAISLDQVSQTFALFTYHFISLT